MADEPVITQPNAGEPAPASGVPTEGAWFDALPDGLKSEKSLEAFKGKPVTAVVESYISAQKSFGSRLPIPQPNDKPEEAAAKRTAILRAMGHPEKPEGYKYVPPAYETMGLKPDEKSTKSFLAAAHNAGLTNDQVQQLVNWQAQDAVASQPDYGKARQECIDALVQGEDGQPGWGSTAPKYVAIAKRGIDAYFPEEVRNDLERAGFYNRPGFIRGMFAMGKNLVEDGILIGEETDTSGRSTSAETELSKIMADTKGPYFDSAHEDHDKYVNRALDLRRYIGETSR